MDVIEITIYWANDFNTKLIEDRKTVIYTNEDLFYPTFSSINIERALRIEINCNTTKQ